MFSNFGKKLFGSRNDRELKRITPIVEQVGAYEAGLKALTDEQLRGKSAEFKEKIANGAKLDDLMAEAFAVCREGSRRILGMRHFDVQLIGGTFLHLGRIAEMKTGEGKTLVATLPVYLNALSGKGVHVVTVNDYLARRDAEWMGRLYRFLGLSTGIIVHDLNDQERKKSYAADVTYGTNNEYGFDYLRDNMKFEVAQQAQRGLNFAIVDEVDSILIDEARTPLIISGPAEESADLYKIIDLIVPKLARDQHYTVDEKARTVILTEDGIDRVEKLLNITELYDPENIEKLHHVNQALRAHTLYKRDREYVIKDGECVIVDEFTGRLMPGRRWSDGLHQAVEAKEKVRVREENRTLATITFQNFFRLYEKLGGMTGTADTEAAEFAKIYELEVMQIPTNRPNIRKDDEDIIYKTEREKFNSVVADIQEKHKLGRPVLVGTVSIDKSERLARQLAKTGIKHNVLNAKQHAREAEIVAQAGHKGAVTISTNMAGRGTDILLGGNAEFHAKAEVDRLEFPEIEAKEFPTLEEKENAIEMARDQAFKEAFERWKKKTDLEHEEVVAAGGLHIIGTERHESRRIDNQLRGRAARQGDPGSSRFYLSLEDDLMRIFGSERIKNMMEMLGMEEGEPIEHRWVTRAVENAQKKVEGHNFDIRKSVFEYDETMNLQREAIYGWRQVFLEGKETKVETLKEIEELAGSLVETHMSPQMSRDEWNTVALTETVDRVFDIKLAEDPEDLRKAVPAELVERIKTEGKERYENREKELQPTILRYLEKVFHLQAIDHHWRDHLLGMEHLREGIGLRGYGQRDPKLEYKKEGYRMFRSMEEAIKEDVLMKLYRVRVEQTQPQPAPRPATVAPAGNVTSTASPLIARAAPSSTSSARTSGDGGSAPAAAAPLPNVPLKAPSRMIESRGASAGSGVGGSAAASSTATVRTGEKVGRNDPCPCGSGKKYKKCHGVAA